jgi:hypothetical protein
MSMAKAKAFGTAILVLAIILASCDPQVSNIQMRRGYRAAGNVGSGGPPVTNQALAAPTGVNTAVLSTGRIRVSWNAVPGATSYKVYYGEPNDSTMKYYAIVTAPSTSWEDDDVLDNGNNYFYQVQAVNATGEGRLSGVTQQAYTSSPTNPPPVSNPFLGTWYAVSYPLTLVFADHSFSISYPGGSHSGSYTYSGNHATLTWSDAWSTEVRTAEITGSNSLRLSDEYGHYDDYTR